MPWLSQRVLNRARTVDFLGKLDDIRKDAASIYLPPGLPLREYRSVIDGLASGREVPAETADIISRSPNGAALFLLDKQGFLILPPFPIREKAVSAQLDTAPLVASLNRDYALAVLLVRLGSYAVGVFQGEKLVSSKVGTGNIHGRHRQGGSSAHRFERHRDKQIEYFLTRVCERAREHIEPKEKSLDYLVYGGAKTTILLIRKQCHFLEKLTIPVLPPLLDIPEPRQAVLEAAVGMVYSSRIYEWDDRS